MSNKTQNNSQDQNEEVDLGQLFKAIGKLFEKLFAFIASIFKGIFSLIIYALKPLVIHFKWVAAIVVAAAVLGYLSDKYLKETSYHSTMLVKPHFDSKYKLISDIDYFNTLINSDNLQKLAKIFEIDTSEAKTINGFGIEVGPETQADLLKQYDNYVKSIEVDSTMLTYLPYNEYLKKRTLLNSEIFSINAIATKSDVFPKLEKGFIKTFENSFSKRLKEKADKVYKIKINTYNKQLDKIDSLQKVYTQVLKNESENNAVGLSGNLLPLAEEKSSTKEYELFKEEIKIRERLRSIEEERIEEKSDYYEIVSNFESIGQKNGLLKRNLAIYPLLAFGLLALLYWGLKIFTFIKEYEQKL